MARIPQAFINDLLNRVDIVEVINRRVTLRKTGKNFSSCCPFHDEKTPSFSVSPEKQFYYCFGCGVGGNALSFVMDYDRIDFPEAVDALAHTIGLEVPKEDTKPNEKFRHDNSQLLLNQLEQTAQFYEKILRESPDASPAVNYLKNRGLTGKVAKTFRLGFAPPGWDNLLGTADLRKQQDLLITSGMLIKNDKEQVYDRFRDRIVFPIVDTRGRVIAFGGRVLGDEKPKYLNSPETPVFQKSQELYGLYQACKANRNLTRIVLVEGYMDVIALAQHGITYAVATLGTATSENHIKQIFRHVSEVIFCFDGDEAGRKAAFRALESTLPIIRDGLQACFLFLPEGEDPDSLVRAKGQKHLEYLFDTAVPLEKFLFNHLAEGLDLNILSGRARLSKLVAPFLDKIPEGVFRTLMYQTLAEQTGIDIESLRQLQISRHAPDAIVTDHPVTDALGVTHSKTVPSGWHTRSKAADTLQPMKGSGTTASDKPVKLEPESHWIIPFETQNQLTHDNSLALSSNNPIQRILRILVLNPEFALDVAVEQLPGGERHDIKLLLELVQHIQAEPSTSTAALLGFWFGTPEGQLLTELASHDPLEDKAGQVVLLNSLLEKLIREQAMADLRTRHNQLKASDYKGLGSVEKQELLELTHKIRELSGRH